MSVYVFMWVHVFVDTGGGQKSALGVFVLFLLFYFVFWSSLPSLRQGSSLGAHQLVKWLASGLQGSIYRYIFGAVLNRECPCPPPPLTWILEIKLRSSCLCGRYFIV